MVVYAIGSKFITCDSSIAACPAKKEKKGTPKKKKSSQLRAELKKQKQMFTAGFRAGRSGQSQRCVFPNPRLMVVHVIFCLSCS